MPPSSSALEPRPEDVDACRAILRAGSKSFAFASWLLPSAIRRSATVFYAFCRVADDAIDEATGDEWRALDALHRRLDRVFAGAPFDDPVDRALTVVVERHAIPRLPFDALLEGFSWDVEGRRYAELGDVLSYGARVAGTVGVVMSHVMGRREPLTLARACDLGVAMQLTNIARDVGADAKLGRLYLPMTWFHELGVDPDAFLARPTPSAEIALMTRRLVVKADELYERARAGVTDLPVGCRTSIHAASLVYAGIHREIERHGWDSVTRRASTTWATKLLLLARALGRTMRSTRGAGAPPLPEVAFLTTSEGRP